MPTFKTQKGLKKYLQKKINQVLADDVFDSVKEIQMRHITEDVLDSYMPKEYRRRGSSGGGIEDADNIAAALPKDGVLEVENRTQFNPEPDTENTGVGLAGLIEYGDGWDGHHYEYRYSNKARRYMQPRPFIENTRKDLKQHKQHVSALKHGLNKRGIAAK